MPDLAERVRMQARVSFDIVALAKNIHRRLQFYERLHGKRPSITPAMSRILEHDPEYVPYRPRAASKRRKPAENPSIRTVVAIAEALECSVAELLGELAITRQDVLILRGIGHLLDRTFHMGVQERG